MITDLMTRRRSQFGEVPARADSQESLHYTCHPAIQPSLPHFWSSAALRLDMEGHDYQVLHLHLFLNQHLHLNLSLNQNLHYSLHLYQHQHQHLYQHLYQNQYHLSPL